MFAVWLSTHAVFKWSTTFTCIWTSINTRLLYMEKHSALSRCSMSFKRSIGFGFLTDGSMWTIQRSLCLNVTWYVTRGHCYTTTEMDGCFRTANPRCYQRQGTDFLIRSCLAIVGVKAMNCLKWWVPNLSFILNLNRYIFSSLHILLDTYVVSSQVVYTHSSPFMATTLK